MGPGFRAPATDRLRDLVNNDCITDAAQRSALACPLARSGIHALSDNVQSVAVEEEGVAADNSFNFGTIG
jgi:hypothetical protein